MKRMLLPAAAAVLLCALSLVVLVYAHGQLTAQGEDVTVTETTLFGDHKEADGIVMASSCDYSGLHWDLTCQPQNPSRPQAVFHYGFPDMPQLSDVSADVDIAYRGTQVTGSFNLEKAALTGDSSEPFLRKALLAMAEDTKPGETTKKTMSLKEWMDYLPVKISCWSAGAYDSDLGVFALPVPDYPTALSVGKNLDGQVNSFLLDLDGNLYVNSFEQIDDTYCYLIFTAEMNGTEKIMDVPADQRGIYRLPVSDFDACRATEFLNSDDRFLLCPFPEDAEVLKLDQNETFLLLYTIEDGGVYLSFIRKDTGVLTDKFLLRKTAEASFNRVFQTLQGKNFCLSVLNDGRFFLLERDGDTYTPAFNGSLNHGSLMEDLISTMIQADFDGRRLAVFAVVDSKVDVTGSVRRGCSFLQIFDSTGLTYMGKYENSLQTLPPDNDMNTPWIKPTSVAFTEEKEASQ